MRLAAPPARPVKSSGAVCGPKHLSTPSTSRRAAACVWGRELPLSPVARRAVSRASPAWHRRLRSAWTDTARAPVSSSLRPHNPSLPEGLLFALSAGRLASLMPQSGVWASNPQADSPLQALCRSLPPAAVAPCTRRAAAHHHPTSPPCPPCPVQRPAGCPGAPTARWGTSAWPCGRAPPSRCGRCCRRGTTARLCWASLAVSLSSGGGRGARGALRCGGRGGGRRHGRGLSPTPSALPGLLSQCLLSWSPGPRCRRAATSGGASPRSRCCASTSLRCLST